MIETCHLAFDLRRAHEWTRALDRWCDAQQKLVAFSGQCQMHRAELYRLHGAWTEAIDAAKTAQDLAFRGDRMATYGGFYQQAEIHRLRGDFDAAEAAYLHAQDTGFPAQPGLALLRLAQGRPDQAQSLLRQAMDGIDPAYRRLMLAARVEIELAAGDAPAARAAVEELDSLCASIDMPLLHALAEQSQAAVLFHDGDPGAALVPLRRAGPAGSASTHRSKRPAAAPSWPGCAPRSAMRNPPGWSVRRPGQSFPSWAPRRRWRSWNWSGPEQPVPGQRRAPGQPRRPPPGTALITPPTPGRSPPAKPRWSGSSPPD